MEYLELLGHDFWKELLNFFFLNVFFWCFEQHKLSPIISVRRQTADISKTLQLTPKLSRWINSSTDHGKKYVTFSVMLSLGFTLDMNPDLLGELVFRM